MNALFRIIPIILKYLVNVGPLAFEAAEWGIKIFREFRKPKKKIAPPEDPPVEVQASKPDLDLG